MPCLRILQEGSPLSENCFA